MNMDVELLKQGLKEILNEDISNRTSIADLRRNVFLQTSKTEEKEKQISVKEEKINELSSEVSYFKNQLHIQEKNLEERTASFSEEIISLREVISGKEKEIADLYAEVEKLGNEVKASASYSSEINKLSIENNHYAEKIREMVMYIEKQQENEALLKEEIERLKADNKNGKELSTTIEALKRSSEAELKTLKEQHSSLVLTKDTEISELKTRLDAIRTEHEETSAVLQEEIQQMEQLALDTIAGLKMEHQHAVFQYQETIEVLKEELTQLEENSVQQIEQLKSAKAEVSAQHEESITVLKEEIAQLEDLSAETIEGLKKEIETVKNISAAGLLELDSIKASVIALENEKQELTLQLQDLKASSEATIAELNNELELKSGLAVTAAESEELKRSLNFRDEEIAALSASITALNNELITLRSTVDLRNEEIIQLNDTIAEVKALLSASQMKADDLHLQNKDLTIKAEAYEQLKNESVLTEESLQNELSVLKNELLEKSTTIAEVEAKVGDLQLTIDTVSKELEQAKAEHADFIAEIESLNKQLTEVKGNINEQAQLQMDELEATLSAKSIQLQELSEQNLELTAQKEELQLIIDSLKSEAETKVQDVQSAANEINQEKLRLEETITDLKRELFKTEEKLEQALEAKGGEEQNDEFIDGLFKKIDLLNDKCQKMETQKEELENQVTVLLARISSYSELSDKQLDTVESLDKNKISTTLASVLSDSLKDKKSLKLKINELVREIDRCIAMLNAQS